MKFVPPLTCSGPRRAICSLFFLVAFERLAPGNALALPQSLHVPFQRFDLFLGCSGQAVILFDPFECYAFDTHLPGPPSHWARNPPPPPPPVLHSPSASYGVCPTTPRPTPQLRRHAVTEAHQRHGAFFASDKLETRDCEVRSSAKPCRQSGSQGSRIL